MSEPLAVRIGDQKDEFFYLGYSFYPGKDVIGASLRNGAGYKPVKFHSNEDGSVTAEWLQLGFGFTGKERQRNFYTYVADLVIPQLEDALQSEIDFDNDLRRVRLQRVTVQAAEHIEEGEVAIKRVLGSMSLFTEVVPSLAVEQRQVA